MDAQLRATELLPPSAIDDDQPQVDGQTGIRHYRMVQHRAARGHDVFIQNEQGETLFKVDGDAAPGRDRLVFRDMVGNELCNIQLRHVPVRNTCDVKDPRGDALVSVRKTMITALRDRYTIRMGHGPNLSVQGNILDQAYRIADEHRTVAIVSKKWFRARDTYGVEIAPGQNDLALLAATVCIDQMIGASR